jgi:hypothetical protein
LFSRRHFVENQLENYCMRRKNLSGLLFIYAMSMTSAWAGVSVTSPANNSTVGTAVQYVATATTSCAKGVSAMGIYTAPWVRVYVVNGARLNTTLTLSPGVYNTVVQEWDNCGGSSSTPIKVTVSAAGVHVASPANNSTVGTPVNYVATATTTCAKGIAAMGIYTAPGVLAYVVNGASLNTNLNLSAGTYKTVVQEWDHCGGALKTPVTITVNSTSPSPTRKTFSNLHAQSGWNGYALLPVSYAICATCKPSGPEATWARVTGISSPSQSGSSTRHDIGGTTQYADVLWNNHLIGDFSTQGLPDTSKTLIPTLHNFIYDVYFYATNIEASQALEFDINQFFGGKSFIWGHECRIAGGHEWDVWDNPNEKWVPTGIPCNPINGWNHVVIQVQRTSNNQLLFQTITLNGKTSTVNYVSNPRNTNWFGVTINYQQDGNYRQQPYSIWLDKLNFSYW